MITRLVPGSRGGRWLLIGLAGIGLVSGLLVLNVSRVVLVGQPSRAQPLDLLGAGVFAQTFRSEVPGLTQIDFTITYPLPAPPPRLRFRLRELPEGPERVNVRLTPEVPGRHGYVTARFPPLPASAGGGYEFSLEREDPTRQPGLQIWGAGGDAYPGGAYRRNGVPVPDSDMTFLASFRMSGWQALGVLEQRLTAERPAPWRWSGTYVVLLLLYGLALGALLVGLSRMATAESPGPG
jgi:hypothetical protein